METERKMEPAELLKKPYARVVVPEADGSYTAEILEFPGCVASGDTAADALANVEEVAIDWIAATLEQGQDIPRPLDHSKYSGKLVVRMPKGLHKRAARAAERGGVSLNQFIVTCIAEEVGARSRPMMLYSAPQAFAFNFHGIPGANVTPISVTASQSPQQFATSASRQLLGVPVQNRREADDARG
jgi:predicted RNase H-like HicB family nuclease